MALRPQDLQTPLHLLLAATPGDQHPHFADGDTEAQEVKDTTPGNHNHHRAHATVGTTYCPQSTLVTAPEPNLFRLSVKVLSVCRVQLDPALGTGVLLPGHQVNSQVRAQGKSTWKRRNRLRLQPFPGPEDLTAEAHRALSSISRFPSRAWLGWGRGGQADMGPLRPSWV